MSREGNRASNQVAYDEDRGGACQFEGHEGESAIALAIVRELAHRHLMAGDNPHVLSASNPSPFQGEGRVRVRPGFTLTRRAAASLSLKGEGLTAVRLLSCKSGSSLKLKCTRPWDIKKTF